MIGLDLRSIETLIKAKLYTYVDDDKNILIETIGIDSRKPENKGLFFAILGDRHDGHDFCGDALRNGYVALVTNRFIENIKAPQLVVNDTKLALSNLAKYYIKTLTNTKVIAITGSCGKTSVKNMLANICSEQGVTRASEKSFNNEIGVPLTVLQTNKNTDYLILEFGVRNPGDLDYLANIAPPDISLVTNVTDCHLDTMKNKENISNEKSKIYKYLRENGIAVVSLDDEFSEQWMSLINTNKKKYITYSNSNDNANVIISKSHSNTKSSKIDIKYCNKVYNVLIEAPGEHLILNSLAAFSLGIAAGINPSKIVKGLCKSKSITSRMEVIELSNNNILINDCYNANPTSVENALKLLVKYPKYKIFIFADMLEMGENKSNFHTDLGYKAKNMGVNLLICYGDLSKYTAKAFGSEALYFSTRDDLIKYLLSNNFKDTAFLVKGSNGMRLQEVTNALLNAKSL